MVRDYIHLFLAHTYEKVPERDQVSDLARSLKRTAHLVIEGSCITFEVTRTSVENTFPDLLFLTEEQITCLYDMDIVFQPNGNFDEVYLYVGAHPYSVNMIYNNLTLGRTYGSRSSRNCGYRSFIDVVSADGSMYHVLDSFWTASHGCSLPIVLVSNIVRPEVHPLCKCPSSRSQTWQPPCQRRLRTQNM